jgi:hypothetical protein
MNYRSSLHAILSASILLMFDAGDALACKVLEKASSINILPEEAVLECIEHGGDPSFNIRQQGGTRPLRIAGIRGANFCAPYLYNACPGNEADNSAPVGIVAKPNIPPIQQLPWEELKHAQIPCGAVANLSQIIMQALFGNVNLNTGPVNLQSTVNQGLQKATSALLGKHVDCADGTFWNILNSAINLVMPGGTVFDYNPANQSFLAPKGAKIVMDSNHTLEIDLMQKGVLLNLPSGGSFTDRNGKLIEIPRNDTIQFYPNGMGVTGSGKRYYVDPKKILDFNPNGALALNEPYWLPAEGNLMTAGATIYPPKWALEKDK